MQKHRTMLNRKPARYVNSMASEMAHGALISGLDILYECQKRSPKIGIRRAYSSVICAVAS